MRVTIRVSPACSSPPLPPGTVFENVRIAGYDIVSNRPKVAAYRAPGVPMAAFGATAYRALSPIAP